MAPVLLECGKFQWIPCDGRTACEICCSLEVHNRETGERFETREFVKNLLWLRSSFGNQNPEQVAMMVLIHNPESQPEVPKICNPKKRPFSALI